MVTLIYTIEIDRHWLDAVNGLGLSIARKLIEARGGEITVHNRSPRGLEVLFLLLVNGGTPVR